MPAFRRTAITALIGLVLGIGFATPGIAQQKTRTERQLIGTWILVSSSYTKPDGTKFEAFGGNTKGTIIFDRTGRFALQEMGDARRKFASNNRLDGTPDENKGIVAGLIAMYGTYSLDATGHTVTLHIERCSFPNWDGTDQNRAITLAGDSMKWGNPAASAGGTADLVWRRAK
jgi:hypothetical protein